MFSPVCLFFRRNTRPFLCEYVRARHIVADTAMMMLVPTVTVTVIHAILAFDARALTPPIGMLVGEDNYIYIIGTVKTSYQLPIL